MGNESGLIILIITCLGHVFGQEIVTSGVTAEGSTGDTIKLECSASKWDAISHTEWKRLHNGTWERIVNHGVVNPKHDIRHKVALSSSDSGKTLTSMLTITDLKLTDAGLYRCEVHRSGKVESYVQHILIVLQQGTRKALQIEQLSMGARAATSAFVSWTAPVGRDPRVERWFYQVHLRYVESGKIQGKIIQVPGPDSTNVTLTDLFPCTTYKVWLTGHSQRFESNGQGIEGTKRENGTLLPGIYRRSISSKHSSFHTLHFVPLETPQREDIYIQLQKDASNNCSMEVSWSPQHVPFGCPVLGLKLHVMTPSTWPDAQVVTSVGGTVEAGGFRESMAYPVSLTAYNKFGEGISSPLFFVSFTKQAPSIPKNLVATAVSCKKIVVKWAPSDEHYQKIKEYKLFISQIGTKERYSRDIPGRETIHVLRPFSNMPGSLVVHVTAISDWGKSPTAKTVFSLQEECNGAGSGNSTTQAATS